MNVLPDTSNALLAVDTFPIPTLPVNSLFPPTVNVFVPVMVVDPILKTLKEASPTVVNVPEMNVFPDTSRVLFNVVAPDTSRVF